MKKSEILGGLLILILLTLTLISTRVQTEHELAERFEVLEASNASFDTWHNLANISNQMAPAHISSDQTHCKIVKKMIERSADGPSRTSYNVWYDTWRAERGRCDDSLRASLEARIFDEPGSMCYRFIQATNLGWFQSTPVSFLNAVLWVLEGDQSMQAGCGVSHMCQLLGELELALHYPGDHIIEATWPSSTVFQELDPNTDVSVLEPLYLMLREQFLAHYHTLYERVGRDGMKRSYHGWSDHYCHRPLEQYL